MIQTGIESIVKIQDIVSNQLPEFILDESPKAVDFLKQYYISQEYQGGPVDLADNLDQYLRVDNLTPETIVDSTTLSSTITSTDTTIQVSSTKGFPNQYGLLKIEDEIITYTGITTDSFTGCVRGFSGISEFDKGTISNDLVFSTSDAATHESSVSVQNLSSLFLKEFYKKLKTTFTPGLENVSFVDTVDVGNFIKRAKDFYSSKGTDEATKILFKVIFGEDPSIINLEDYLIKPSSANYVRREVVIVEAISGNPLNIVGETLIKTSDENTTASISAVEPFTRKNKTFYKVEFYIGNDGRSSVEGVFIITPNTKLVDAASAGDSILTVDSTVSFPESGTLISGDNTISYTGKSINQFFGCTGVSADIATTSIVRSNDTYFSYEGGDTSKKVELLILGVINDFEQQSENFNTSEGDIITIKSIGDKIKNTNSNWKEIFANSFIYNTSTRYQITDNGSNQLGSKIDRSSLKDGDEIEVLERGTEVVFATNDPVYIQSVNTGNTLDLNNNPTLDSNKKYDVRRKLNKAKSAASGLPDILNLYVESDEYAYVASNSLPSKVRTDPDKVNNYRLDINTDIKTITISSNDNLKDLVDDVYNTFEVDDVPFLTGDTVFYSPATEPLVGLNTGTYFVKKLSNRKFQIYGAQSLIVSGSNQTFQLPESGTIGTHTFILNSQKDSEIGVQKLLRKFPLQKNIKDGSGELTVPGSTGMLINGVEINNYKSTDVVYYGPIESSSVLSGGEGYDVINPPLLDVSSGVAKIQPVVSGKITEVFVDTQDYDIDKVTSIEISGGNGKGAVIDTVLVSRPREVLFDADEFSTGGGVDPSTNQIVFLTDHNFVNGQQVVYNSLGNNPISIGTAGYNFGLPNNSSCFVGVTNNKTIKLYYTLSDQEAGINPVGIYTGSVGSHKFSTLNTKKQIDFVKVIDGGEGYTNRKLIVKAAGISTIHHCINFKNHGFEDGEIINYAFETSGITGISTANQYYVLKVNDNSFRLCDAGIGGTITTNYDRGYYQKLNSTGSGYQYFSYPNISVAINYTTSGIGSTTQTLESLVVTPTVKGSIIDSYVYEGGTGYGSTILNYENKPTVDIKNGKLAQVTPIVVGGRITNVAVSYEGMEYYSVPELVVSGEGTAASFRAIIADGKISEIKVLNPGVGYAQSTTSIKVVSSGEKGIIDPQIRKLTVNDNVSRFSTGEVVLNGKDKLQYSVSKYFADLRSSFLEESDSRSGIIGWAYDGNPIYGPNGYPNAGISSGVKTLKSGYTLDITNVTDRPSEFVDGFFVEDYKFDDSGDLDEYNGRFEKNKEFPNGVYAYHATIDEFPYFIGNSYKSELISDSNLDQSFDFNNSNLQRNTLPYKVSEEAADYDFFSETSDVLEQKIEVVSVKSDSIGLLEIQNAGTGYKVGDKLIFDETNSSGSGLDVDVKSVKGKDVVDIVTSTTTHLNSVFTWDSSEKVKVTILPKHELLNFDYVTISGFSTNLSELNGTHRISVPSYLNGRCLSSITSASVGFTTEIYLTPIPEQISVGSSIGIGTETLRVLGIFRNQNILRVERGLAGTSHTVGTAVSFLPDSFTVSKSLDKFDSTVNDKAFFNPRESVGVSTLSGVGYSTSFVFGDISAVTKTIPARSIHIDNHPFANNQSVTFTRNGSNLSVSTTGISTQVFDLTEPANLFVINKNPNLIGLKTEMNGPEVFFHSNGSDDDRYSLESNYTQILGDVQKNEVTVSVSTAHELKKGDSVTLNVQPNLSVGIGTSTGVRVLYKSNIDNIVVNPIGFNSTGVNTTTNEITLNDHLLETGDKVLYEDGSFFEYYVYRVDKNTFKLCQTRFDANQNPPTVVSFASTGSGSQSIALINPQLNPIKNNDLVFDVSDSSLSGYELKIYTDSKFNNEFVSTGSTNNFTVSGVGTVGVTSTASLTLNYSSDIPEILYYTLEKVGTVVDSDNEVLNYSEIRYKESIYNNTYTISGVGTTSFTVNLTREPEKSSYISTDCDTLEYSTTSAFASGPVSSLKVLSFGSGYKQLPTSKSTNSVNGLDLIVNAKSNTVGLLKEHKVLDNRFTYDSDKTLRPKANVSPNITLKNFDTVLDVSIVSSGEGYSNAPILTIVDSVTREVIDSGILRSSLTGSAISSVDVEIPPSGLPDHNVEIFATENTNGIAVISVESSNSGIFTCALSTPGIGTTSGFVVQPFGEGDQVFVEGIQKFSTTGDGFNSSDYGYKFFTVTNYNTSGLNDTVTLSVAGLTTNTGIAKTEQDYSGIIVNKTDYPVFETTKKLSKFIIGESLSSNGITRDLKVAKLYDNNLTVTGLYELSVGEIIKGVESGNTGTIESLHLNEGSFTVNYSNVKDIGWSDGVGKLSEDYQVIPDNDYYQNLSYSIKSSITYKDQQSPVENLVHTSGLKNFADTGITSSTSSGVDKTNDAFTIIYDIVGEKRVDTINNFDNVVDVDVAGKTSKFLALENKLLTNASTLRNLDVLTIDDLSKQFSNSEAETTEFLSVDEVDNETYYNYLFKVTNTDGSEIQLTDVTILSDGKETVIVENESLQNAVSAYGTFDLFENKFDETFLRFTPVDPLNTDYDIKLIKQTFNTSISGVGTQPVGFVTLTGSVDIENTSVGLGTTTIVSVNSNTYETLYINAQVVNDLTKDMNYVRLYVAHDGTHSYMSEYYIDGNLSATTGNQIGTFYSNLNGGVLSITHENTSTDKLNIRANVVGMGTTTGGIGTYRFKSTDQLDGQERSAIYESNFQSTVGIASTTIQTLDRSLFDSSKSVIQVSAGSTKALHQVMMITDGTDVYTQQLPFLSVGTTSILDTASGIGTFGGEISGSNMILKFYPDNTTQATDIEVFSKSFYKLIDVANDYNNLVYGPVTESVDEKFYNAINGARINKKNFTLLNNQTPIFSKTFNPNSVSLAATSGIFSIDNHFFQTGEELIYTPHSTIVGVGTSAMMTSATTGLSTTVYAIKVNENQFKVAVTTTAAAAGIGTTFTSLGEGNAHRFTMKERNSKCIINVDKLVQYPIAYAGIAHTISENVGLSTNIIPMSGISSLNPRDILLIDDEYMGIVNIGYGTTIDGPITNSGSEKLVEVDRAFVGSSATTHTKSTVANLYRGSFNIVDNEIHFAEPPRGNPQIDKTDNNLDYETSSFNGRVFLKSNYDNNRIYDDISDKFTGIGRTFNLTVGGGNTSGIGTAARNGLIFVNNIYQSPKTDNNPSRFNYIITDDISAGISTVSFSGITSYNAPGVYIVSDFDINQNETPRGGIIVSYGSTPGLGFAPLVGASVTAVVGAGGTFISVGLGTTDNLGSGYNGLVSIGVTVVDLEYTHRFVSAGVNSITDNTSGTHTATDAVYNSATGDLVLTIANHGLATTNTIGIATGGLVFTCSKDNYASNHAYPRAVSKTKQRRGVSGGDPIHNQQVAIAATTLNTVQINVGPGGGAGTGANISVNSIGVGGTLSFTVGSAGTNYVNPQVFVSDPSYENLPVTGVYREGIGNTTTTGIGLLMDVIVGGATTTVGIGSTYFEVKEFQFSRPGYAFKRGDRFKPVGLVTDSTLGAPLNDFEITVLDTYTDNFAAWEFGELDYIDSIKNYQDGIRVRFPLKYNGELLSFEPEEGSPIERNINNVLIIFINGIIQEPVVNYLFNGGTSFVFTKAPLEEDEVEIYFYKGIDGTDANTIITKPTIKKGDIVQVISNNSIPNTITQEERTVYNLTFSDKFETNRYFGEGIDESNPKPLSWTKQKSDKKVSGEFISKVRDISESLIFPTAKIIKDVSTTDTEVFVDNAELFEYENKVNDASVGTPYPDGSTPCDALIVENTNPVSAAFTATIGGGVVSGITTNNPGSGYLPNQTTIELKFTPPVGAGTTATATASVTAGVVTSVTITNPGSGYTVAPTIFAEKPNINVEKITAFSTIEGFSGIVTGITTSAGTGSNPLAIQFTVIHKLNGTPFVGLETGYPIYINDTTVGNGVTSINSSDSETVGIGTTCVDNVYYVSSFSHTSLSGDTHVGILTCNVNSGVNTTGISTSGTILNPVGKYSWGRLSGGTRSSNPISIGVTGNVVSGLATYPTIQRRGGVNIRSTGALPKIET